MFTSLDEIKLGARYKEVVTDFIGIVTSKAECLTGCDRVTLEGQSKDGGKSEIIGCDITCLEYVDDGVTTFFNQTKKEPAFTPGGPITRH